MNWVSVKDRLPELTEPMMGFNDDNEYVVWFENFQVTVLGYNKELGVFKAKIVRGHAWSEISSNSHNGTKSAMPTHWMPLPEPPK